MLLLMQKRLQLTPRPYDHIQFDWKSTEKSDHNLFAFFCCLFMLANSITQSISLTYNASLAFFRKIKVLVLFSNFCYCCGSNDYSSTCFSFRHQTYIFKLFKTDWHQNDIASRIWMKLKPVASLELFIQAKKINKINLYLSE